MCIGGCSDSSSKSHSKMPNFPKPKGVSASKTSSRQNYNRPSGFSGFGKPSVKMNFSGKK